MSTTQTATEGVKLYTEDATLIQSEHPYIEPDMVEIPGLEYNGMTIKFSKYLCTFDEYLLFCAATGKEIPSDEGWGYGRQPVKNICALDAAEYCNWLNQMTGRPLMYIVDFEGATIERLPDPVPYVQRYQLPTEAEWIYASGEVEEKLKSLTNDEEKRAYLNTIAWYAENSNNHSHEVGLLAPNMYGLFDIIGNMWEITLIQ